MSEALRIAHVGDLHFWSFTFNPALLLGKRVLGQGNLAYRRWRQFRTATAPQLASALIDAKADWYLFSGDFSTTALPTEFAQANRFLTSLQESAAGRVLAVPGNHDRYTRRDLRNRTMERCLPWMEDIYPRFVWLSDSVAAILIDGTVSNGFRSFGELKPEDARAIADWMRGDGARARHVVVLCHFPAEDPPGVRLKPSRRNELHGAETLMDTFRADGRPVLFLHGHHHHRWLYRSATAPNVLFANAGAPFLRAASQRHPDRGFLMIAIEGESARLEVHASEESSERWTVRPVPIPATGDCILCQDLSKDFVTVR